MGRPRIYAKDTRSYINAQLPIPLIEALKDAAREQRITYTELLERLLSADPIIKAKLNQTFTTTNGEK